MTRLQVVYSNSKWVSPSMDAIPVPLNEDSGMDTSFQQQHHDIASLPPPPPLPPLPMSIPASAYPTINIPLPSLIVAAASPAAVDVSLLSSDESKRSMSLGEDTNEPGTSTSTTTTTSDAAPSKTSKAKSKAAAKRGSSGKRKKKTDDDNDNDGNGNDGDEKKKSKAKAKGKGRSKRKASEEKDVVPLASISTTKRARSSTKKPSIVEDAGNGDKEDDDTDKSGVPPAKFSSVGKLIQPVSIALADLRLLCSYPSMCSHWVAQTGNEDDDTVCCVCFNGEVDDDNQIVICSGCDIGVHQYCYGVMAIPKDDWYCAPCQAKLAGTSTLTNDQSMPLIIHLSTELFHFVLVPLSKRFCLIMSNS
jgi:hypothetical protein